MKPEDKKEVRKIIAESFDEVFSPGIEKMINDSENSISKKIDLKLKFLEQKIDEKMDKKFKKYNNEIMTSLDTILKEVKDSREEQIFSSHNIEKLTEKDLDHEKRIIDLEEKMA